MLQYLTLNLDPATANALIAALEVARRQGDFQVARTAVTIISELLRQDEEFKKSQPAPTNAGGEPSQP
jgi:hypothetical protein